MEELKVNRSTTSQHIQLVQLCDGKESSLHYLRTKDGAEVDFVLCEAGAPAFLIECKHADKRPSPAFVKFAELFPQAQSIQLVRELRQDEYRRPVSILSGAKWLAGLTA